MVKRARRVGRPMPKAAAVAILVALLLAGCGRPAGCDVAVDGAKLFLAFGQAPPMSALGAALVDAGWNVTEGARELAATKSYAGLDAPPERQAIHLSLVQPAAVENVTTAQLSSHIAASDEPAAKVALGPASDGALATLRPRLGEPAETVYDPC